MVDLCGIVQIVSAAVTTPSAAPGACVSEDVCNDYHPLCSSSDQITDHLHTSVPEVNPDTDSHMTAHYSVSDGAVKSDKTIDLVLKDDTGDNVIMDVLELSSFDTTLDYSVCSDKHHGKIAETCEAQTTIEYYDKSATESAADVQKNPVADIRADASVTSDIQKSVDLLTMSNSVNMDLRNSRKVCSPPTLMVV